MASTAFVSMGIASELSDESNREGIDAIMVLFWSLCVKSLIDVVNDGDGRLCVESKKPGMLELSLVCSESYIF